MCERERERERERDSTGSRTIQQIVHSVVLRSRKLPGSYEYLRGAQEDIRRNEKQGKEEKLTNMDGSLLIWMFLVNTYMRLAGVLTALL